MRAVVTIPGVRLKPPGNRREHWRVVQRRAAAEKTAATLYCRNLGADTRAALQAAPRLAVRFVKVGGRKMDSDNLVAALKYYRDAVADWLGRDDGDDWFRWEWPAQEPGKEYSVRIELEAVHGD